MGSNPPSSGYTRRMPVIHIDPEVGANTIIKTPQGNIGLVKTKKGTDEPLLHIAHPECSAIVEDFFSGETSRWLLTHPEIHYILKGKATVTYTLAPWHDELKEMMVEEGDSYLIPAGTDITFKVAPESPLRKLMVMMPTQPEFTRIPPKDVAKL